MSAIPGTIVPIGMAIAPAGSRGPSGLDTPGPQGPEGETGDVGPEGDSVLPTGIMLPFGGYGLPAGGWLLCDGSWYNVSDFPGLYAVIGYNFGGGGPHFAVPDTKGRILVGVGGLDSEPSWYWWIGHKHGVPRVQLLPGQIPIHQHSVDINHNHTVWVNGHAHPFSPDYHDHGPHSHMIFGGDPYMGSAGHTNNSHDYYVPVAPRGEHFCELRYAGAAWTGGFDDWAGNMGGWTNYVSEVGGNWQFRDAYGQGGWQAHDNCQPGLGTNYIIKT